MLAEIDARIVAWAEVSGGILRKFERDKYVFVFQRQFLIEFEEKKFDILEKVKEINIGNKIPVTLSIGIDNSGNTYSKNLQYALASLEIALGRGGDHAVVRNTDNILFFGGKKLPEMEKRTRVKACNCKFLYEL
jgi:c-di-AMP phosphodiesterase-like protein